ncbi:hypothetical protein PFISCL1PPCAC_22077, partial [Pristionchus fissidentatus]
MKCGVDRSSRRSSSLCNEVVSRSKNMPHASRMPSKLPCILSVLIDFSFAMLSSFLKLLVHVETHVASIAHLPEVGAVLADDHADHAGRNERRVRHLPAPYLDCCRLQVALREACVELVADHAGRDARRVVRVQSDDHLVLLLEALHVDAADADEPAQSLRVEHAQRHGKRHHHDCSEYE